MLSANSPEISSGGDNGDDGLSIGAQAAIAVSAAAVAIGLFYGVAMLLCRKEPDEEKVVVSKV